MKDSDLFDSPCACMGPHVRKSIKKHDTHIKPKSYKLELFRRVGCLTVTYSQLLPLVLSPHLCLTDARNDVMGKGKVIWMVAIMTQNICALSDTQTLGYVYVHKHK